MAMTVEGLWTTQFEGVPNFLGGGVVMLLNGRIYGGDSEYFYSGLYSQTGPKFEAMVEVKAFAPAPTSVFGLKEQQFSVRIQGDIIGDNIAAIGMRPDFPQARLSMRLKKRADFPQQAK